MAEKQLATTEIHPKAGGAAVGGAVAIVAVWVAGLVGLEVPTEVALAFGTIFAFAGSYIAKSPEA